MHKSATKCNETVGKWCINKHGASKIIDTLETYQRSRRSHLASSFICVNDPEQEASNKSLSWRVRLAQKLLITILLGSSRMGHLRTSDFNLPHAWEILSPSWGKKLYIWFQLTRVNSTNVLDEGLRIREIGRRMISKVKSVKQVGHRK
jgi:hypothetical protein